MNRSNRSNPQRPSSRTKRGQQMSLGGLLLAVLVALITWWSGAGSPPTAQPANAIATPLIEVAGEQSAFAATPTVKSAGKKATPRPQIRVVGSAKPNTPTKTPTPEKKATPKAAKAATATPRPSATATRAKSPTPTVKPPTPTPKPQRASGVSGLPTIRYEQLPKEAQRTLELIDRDGPFPFYQDGAIFQNREGNLPRQARNYYHEYTVITPGEDDRGARRIVTGDRGEIFYTDDHYASFREVVR